MTRLIAAAVITLSFALSAGSPATAAEKDSGTASTPSLKETLEKGLKARRPEEFAFIATVVRKVERGVLPRSLVESTFLWARGKDTHPFQYFQQGLRVRAEKMGVVL